MPSKSPTALLSILYTLEDRALLHKEISALEQALFQTKKNAFPEVLKSGVRAHVSEIIEREIREQKKKPDVYLQEVAQEIDALPVFELTIAFSPTPSAIQRFTEASIALLETPLLLKLIMKPEIIGGAVMVWNGKYHDASLQEAFQTASARVTAKYFAKAGSP